MTDRQACHGYLNLTEKVLGTEMLDVCDVAVLARSWEQRSTAALKRLTGKPLIVMLTFLDPPAPDCLDPAADALLAEAAAENRFVEVKLGLSTAYRANCLAIRNALAVRFAPATRILLDITSIPKVYTMSIVGWSFSERRVSALRFYYNEGDYRKPLDPASTNEEAKLASFTTGKWALISPPFLEGDMGLGDGSKLVAFCGGDHERILEVMAEYEHLSRWAILTSDTPKSPDPIALRHAASLEQNANLSKKHVQYADPLSAIDALVRAREILRAHSNDPGVGGVVLPFSTKPHAIAAAALGIFGPRVTILARQPDAYIPHDIQASERAIQIDLADLSSPEVSALL